MAIHCKVGVRAQDAVWSGTYNTNAIAPGYNSCIAVVPQRQSTLTASSVKKAARPPL
jgi:hypothetical protein